jgi:hypothetical protein
MADAFVAAEARSHGVQRVPPDRFWISKFTNYDGHTFKSRVMAFEAKNRESMVFLK